MQRADHPDAKQANTQALHDLEMARPDLTLVFAGANGAYGFGLEPSAEAVAQILDGIYLDAGIGIELQVGRSRGWRRSTSPNISSARGSLLPPANIRFGLDPLGACAVWDRAPIAGPRSCPRSPAAIKGLAALGFKVRSRPPMAG